MLFVPTHSIVYNSSLRIGGVAFDVTPSDVEILEGKGQVILTEAETRSTAAAEAVAEESTETTEVVETPVEHKAKTKTAGGATNGKQRTARKAKG